MKQPVMKEVWKEFPLGYKSKFRYAVSNYGRVVSFTDDIKNGKPIEGGKGKYYRKLVYSFKRNGQVITKLLYFHQLVGAFFLPNKPEGKAGIIHLDFDRTNNRVDNLRWATREEVKEYLKKDPGLLESKLKHLERSRAKLYKNSSGLLPTTTFLPGEVWKEIKLEDTTKFRYAVSNMGRTMSFVDKFETGRVLSPGKIEGYKTFMYKIFRNGKVICKNFFIRRLVAQYFLPPPTPDQTFVLYLDHNKNNNRVDNLRWATKVELYAHTKKSPNNAKGWRDRKRKGIGKKLTSTQVQLIKLKLFDPNRKTRMKMLAKQYGISGTALQRIKSGENWGHVKVKWEEKKTDNSLFGKKG